MRIQIKLKNKLWKQSKYRTCFYFFNKSIYMSYLGFIDEIDNINIFANKNLIK